MSRPEIAFFLRDLDGGGAERAIAALAGNVAARGYSVDLVVGDAAGDYRGEVASTVRLVDFGTRSIVGTFRALLAYLRAHRPAAVMSALDVANIMLVGAVPLAGYRGRVVVSQRAVVDASLRELPFLRRAVTERLLRSAFRRADAIVSNSRAASAEVAARFGVAPSRLTTIHNALDFDRIARLALAAVPRPTATHALPTVVSVGSLTKRKDVATLIEAFARVRARMDALLIVIGRGPEQAGLVARAEALGVAERVHFAGFLPNPYPWIAAASVFVSSSTEEGFPNVVAEALALGRRVVATDCPGDTALILERGAWGTLVPVGDADRMAEAICAALVARDWPDVTRRAQHFAPVSVTTAYLSVLRPAAAGTTRAYSGEH